MSLIVDKNILADLEMADVKTFQDMDTRLNVLSPAAAPAAAPRAGLGNPAPLGMLGFGMTTGKLVTLEKLVHVR